MTDFLIATREELELLSKGELRVYEMFRLQGKTKEEICSILHISKETFRTQWSRARNKILRYRSMTENPQRYLAKGQDIFSVHSSAPPPR